MQMQELKRKPSDNYFLQQRHKTYYLNLSAPRMVIMYTLLGFLLLGIGVSMLLKTNEIVEVSERYDDE